MNHPTPEEWVPYVFEEASPNVRRTLDEHLAQCAECRARIEGWQGSLRRLDAWQLPEAAPRRAVGAPLMKWAAAAALVLGLGFGLGRLTTPRVNFDQLRAALEPELRQQCRQEAAQLLRVELEQLEAKRVADFVALKKDLDTVAVLTDASLRDTQQRLIQLAEFSAPVNAQYSRP